MESGNDARAAVAYIDITLSFDHNNDSHEVILSTEKCLHSFVTAIRHCNKASIKKLYVSLHSKALLNNQLSARRFERFITAFYQTALGEIEDPFFDLIVIPRITSFLSPPWFSLPRDVTLLLVATTTNKTITEEEAIKRNVALYTLGDEKELLVNTTVEHAFKELILYNSAAEAEEEKQVVFEHTAVGGTFDHLHYGHKVMLTVAVYVTRTSLLVGITGDELLKKKAFKEEIQSYDERQRNVKEFLLLLKRDDEIVYNLVEINDIYGPTATQVRLDLLVLSKETLSSAQLINQKRIESNLSPIHFFAIDLLPSPACLASEDSKLSSTALRKQQQSLKHQTKQL